MVFISMNDVYVVDVRKSPYAKLVPIPLNRIVVNDAFWRPRLIGLVEKTLPMQYDFLEKTGRIDNFRIAAGLKSGEYTGLWFNDSDVYKWVEASSYALIHKWSDDLYKAVENVVDVISRAQERDGYLNTYIQLNKLERWANLAWSHELYCAGHLFQAAVAARRALGNETLFKVALKFADLLSNVFGFEENKLKTADGHPEVEMALVELFRESGDRKYLELARFFIDVRGRGLVTQTNKNPFIRIDSVYLVDHEPIRIMNDFAGSHAVRALYLFAGGADLYLETGDEELLNALKRLWRKMLLKMYITGGLGSRYEGEAFGEDYELPNERAYSETCAAVAGVMWAWRMFLATGDAEYMNVLETILYNAALAGISIDGTKYFYVNPLADPHAKHERRPWYECACCPPNIARLLAFMPSIAYAISKNESKIWINLFIGSIAEVNLHGNRIKIEIKTNYPWEGHVEIRVYPEKSDEFSIMIRIPSWGLGTKIRVEENVIEPKPGEYAEIRRKWSWGDAIEVKIPLKPRFIKSHHWIESNYGKVAIARGPLIYCIEQVDNKEFDVRNLAVKPDEAKLEEEYRKDMLNGIVVIKGHGYELPSDSEKLYRDFDETLEKPVKKLTFTAIPYYAWNNRGATKMLVWIKTIQ